MTGWGGQAEVDLDLLAEARRGDVSAAVRILDPHRERIFVIVKTIVRWKDGEREVFHDLLIDSPRILNAYQPDRGPLGPYIYRTARNRALEVLRKHGIKHVPLEEVDYETHAVTAQDAVERRVIAGLQLVDILASLTHEDVVVLRTCLRWTTDEDAAHLLGLSVQGVRTRRVRLRRRLAIDL
ncbi:MAG: hypothetical protein AAGA99_26730 [Actinomycetota bacterium]